MTFSEKLKQAMQELHLNQRQVCGMTGKSKGSVSQYLSGKQIPSEDVQSGLKRSHKHMILVILVTNCLMWLMQYLRFL